MLAESNTLISPAFMSLYDKSYATSIPEISKKRPRTDSITSITSFKSIALSDILDELDESHGFVPVFSAQSDIQWNVKVFPNEYEEDEVNLEVAFGESEDDDNYAVMKDCDNNINTVDDATPIRRGRAKSSKKNILNNTPRSSTPKGTKGNKSDKSDSTKRTNLSKSDKNVSIKKKVTIINDKDKIKSNSKEVKTDKIEIKDVPKNNTGSYLFKIDYDYNSNVVSNTTSKLSYNSNEGKYSQSYYNQSLVPAYSTQSILSSATVSANGVIRIGAYTKEERQQRIHRFREKKNKRIWRKQIKYDCRKKLADTRPRVKGRFVSRAEELGGNPSSDNGDGDNLVVYDNDETDSTIVISNTMSEMDGHENINDLQN